MKVTVLRTQTQLTLNNTEMRALGDLLSSVTSDHARTCALYEQLSAISGNFLYKDDASEFYADARLKHGKALNAVRHSRNQSRMTVELRRATKKPRRHP